MTGAEYIAEFLARVGSNRVFLLTGGACAFMIDAVARHPKLSYTCFPARAVGRDGRRRACGACARSACRWRPPVPAPPT